MVRFSRVASIFLPKYSNSSAPTSDSFAGAEYEINTYLRSACPHRTSVVLKSIISGQSILIGVGAMAISVLDESSPHPDMTFC